MTKQTISDRRFVGGLSVALLVFSGTVQLVPDYAAVYVPINLTLTALLLGLARRVGLDRSDLGLERDRLSGGLRSGVLVALVAVAALAVAVAIPAFHPLLEDERVGEIGYGLLAYRTLIRVPLGTALLEEAAFRGVLFGAWSRWAGTKSAVIGSSALFGLWHIRPTLELLSANDLAGSGPAQAGAVAGAVVLTAAAGVLFCWLRIRSGSLLAPFVTHVIVNSSAMVAAFAVLNWV